MNKNVLKSVLIVIVLLCFLGCANLFENNLSRAFQSSAPQSSAPKSSAPQSSSSQGITPQRAPSRDFVTFSNLNYPTVMYYGANLGYFPPKVREWIMNSAFTKSKMEGASMLNPSLKVFWDKDDNKVLAEAAYTIAQGYVGAGTQKTWGEGAAYSGSSNIARNYGNYAYYQTLRFKYEHSLYVQRLLQTDRAFAEIINFAKQLCSEIEYDWRSFSGYKGPVRPTPGKRLAVCDGYANEVMDKALRLSSVRAVQKWTGPGHAWNVLILTDGRTLFFDLTWFDNEHINEQTGAIYQTDDYGWENITFFEHLFRFSNVGYGSGQFAHNMGKLNKEVKK